MSDRIAHWPGIYAVFLLAVIVAGSAGLSSCASGSTGRADGGAQARGENTGTFPNLNIPPKAAAAQLTAEQKQERLAQLEAEKRRLEMQGAVTGMSTDSAQLKRLGDTHARDTLKAIEKN